jgi:hypothetical protein
LLTTASAEACPKYNITTQLLKGFFDIFSKMSRSGKNVTTPGFLTCHFLTKHGYTRRMPRKKNTAPQTIAADLRQVLSHIASASAKLEHVPVVRAALADLTIDMNQHISRFSVDEVKLGAIVSEAGKKNAARRKAMEDQGNARADAIEKLSDSLGECYNLIGAEALGCIKNHKKNDLLLNECLTPVQEFINEQAGEAPEDTSRADTPERSTRDILSEWQEQFTQLGEVADSEMDRLRYGKLRELVNDAAELYERNRTISQQAEELHFAAKQVNEALQILIRSARKAADLSKH